MAFSKSIHKAQIPIGCQLCESGTTIQWKCVNCSLLLCIKCKEIHLKIKNVGDHKIVDIKEVRRDDESKGILKFSEIDCQDHDNQTCVFYCKSCEKFICTKCITKSHKGHDAVDEDDYQAELNKLLDMQRETESKLSKLALTKVIPSKSSPQKLNSEKKEIKENPNPNIKVTRQFTTGLNDVHTVISDSHDSVWIADWYNDVLNQLKVTKDNIQVKSKLNISVFDMAVYSTNSLLLSVHNETRVKLLNDRTLQISDSKYSTAPLFPHCLNISRDKKVIVGAVKSNAKGQLFKSTGRRAVIVMDEEGNRVNQYEHDSNNEPLFTLPSKITSTNNGNICVADVLDESYRGRVVILGNTGNILQIYNGHSDIDSQDSPFRPTDIKTTPADNIIVANYYNHTLHILSCDGVLIKYIMTEDVEIFMPYSLALYGPEQLYIGCLSDESSEEFVKAKLYQVRYSGF